MTSSLLPDTDNHPNRYPARRLWQGERL